MLRHSKHVMVEMNFEYEELSDEELVELSASGDRRATEFILTRYKNLVKRRASAFFLAGADHDDMVQEAMIGLFKAVRDFDVTKQPSFRAFAELCIKRNMISAIKAATRKKHAPLNSYVSLSEPVYDNNDEWSYSDILTHHAHQDTTNPESMFLRREKAQMLNDEIEKKLSTLEKKVLALYLSGMNYTRIAEELGREPKSVDNALQRIRRKLDKAKD